MKILKIMGTAYPDAREIVEILLEVREWQQSHTVESELAEFDQAFAKIEKEERLGALL